MTRVRVLVASLWGMGGGRNAGGTILRERVWRLTEIEANSVQTDV
jgi:hypothetical protein